VTEFYETWLAVLLFIYSGLFGKNRGDQRNSKYTTIKRVTLLIRLHNE